LESLPVEHLEATGPREVRVELVRPVIFSRKRLAEVRLLPADVAACESLTDLSHLSGTGPFRQVEALEPGTLRLERFEGYWDSDPVLGPLPLLDEVVLAFEPDLLRRIRLLDSGRAQVGLFIGSFGDDGEALLAKAKGEGRPALVRLPVKSIAFYLSELVLSAREGTLLADPRVRRAIGFSLDRAALAHPPAVPLHRFLDPRFSAYRPSVEGFSLDRERAAALLEAAGIDLTASPPTLRLGCLEVFRRRCEEIASQLTEAGWRVERHELVVAAMERNLEIGEIDATVGGFLYPYYGTEPWPYLTYIANRNRARTGRGSRIASIYERLDRAVSQADRIALYGALEEALLEDATLIPLVGGSPEDAEFDTIGSLLDPRIRGLPVDDPGAQQPLRDLVGVVQTRILTDHNLAALRHVWLADDPTAATSPSGE
ncbi:MAG: ABC transporter substrate-binding protein, partial [Deltaproteobacteria bacterium]|nr:ABC transporter substrate-binding protein [Deltaproteobacteria bacterium]